MIHHQPPCIITPVHPTDKDKDKGGKGKGGEEDKGKKGKGGAEEIGAVQPAPAFLVVTLPAEARLTIDGAPTKLAVAERTFQTPELEPGKIFHYTLVAEVMRDGKPVTTTQKVAVQAGQETRVTLDLPTTTAVAAR
jgi:uncharacterized protein (TIGR03000 family)